MSTNVGDDEFDGDFLSSDSCVLPSIFSGDAGFIEGSINISESDVLRQGIFVKFESVYNSSMNEGSGCSGVDEGRDSDVFDSHRHKDCIFCVYYTDIMRYVHRSVPL